MSRNRKTDSEEKEGGIGINRNDKQLELNACMLSPTPGVDDQNAQYIPLSLFLLPYDDAYRHAVYGWAGTCPTVSFLKHKVNVKQGFGSGIFFLPNSDPGLCISNEGRFVKNVQN